MAIPDEQYTRIEKYLNLAATGSGDIPDAPLTRIERYLAKIAGQDIEVPAEAYTRIEQYLAAIAESGGGGGGGSDNAVLYTAQSLTDPQKAQARTNIGDRVHYPDEDGAIYESLIDANVYSPEAYPQGWGLIE